MGSPGPVGATARGVTIYHADVDNTLAYMDQASFLGLRALGRAPIMQFTWIYSGEVDIAGLRRFHRNLGSGLLGRRIERSPLPFGRHRWISSAGPADIAVAAAERPRAEVSTWADERIVIPIDPEHGPAWHLGVVPLAEGGAAVSLVVSHSIADALGLTLTIADAAEGIRRDLGYPPPGSVTRRQALLRDARLAFRGLPEVGRAVLATVRVAREQSEDLAASSKSAAPVIRPGSLDPVIPPTVTAYIDLNDWDRRVESLGGTSNSLFAGFAARLGQLLGRVDADGRAMLSFPVSDRTAGDTRGNALNTVTAIVDPAKANTDLTEIRGELKRVLSELGAAADANLAPLPITPYVPKFLVRRLERMVLKVGSPIGCSNLGELPPALNRPDGTDADDVSFRLVEPGITPGALESMGGWLYLASGRGQERIFLTVSGWTAGEPNTRAELSEAVRHTLADFDLPGNVD
ncbi:hypothetical protein [Mycolicibacterium lutetiense]|uniref:Fatty acyl-AMP ligase FadD28 and polyketide synthase n=1 Tax=Mycolicibacterium lutetiense TaxID=1641992 RepID=A0ABS4ZT10_9MYCO|nr:hypothetical protein [Mycolicibacterium lutetiense]MBP2452614.1 hypothetical protein [Mycolicibacterium lutetiense]